MKFLSSEKLSAHKYKTSEGYLICTDAILARTGKQTYRRCEVFACDDESEIEVDRPSEEVFSPATLASFENKPITVEHPDENVTSDNYSQLSVGFVRDVKKGIVNGQEVMLGTLVITDANAIEEIENGEHTDLSCGYDCDIIDDANPTQRNIRGNHVALCEQGRAGIARIVDSIKTNDAIAFLETYQGSDIWQDEHTKELYVAMSKSGKKLGRLNTNDLDKAKKIINERNSSLDDAKCKDDIVFDYTEEDLKRAQEMLEKAETDDEKKLLSTLVDKIKFELQSRQTSDSECNDAVKDSERRAYTFVYKTKLGLTYKFRCNAEDSEDARNQLYDWAEERNEMPIKIISTDMTYDAVKDARRLNYDDDIIKVYLNGKEVFRGYAEDWIDDSFDDNFKWTGTQYEATNAKGKWVVKVVDSIRDANKNVSDIISYFNAWGYPLRSELQEAVDFYKMSKEDVKKVFGSRYDKDVLNNLKCYDSAIKDAEKDDILDYLFSKKYQIKQQHANNHNGEDVIIYTAISNQIGKGIQFAYNTVTHKVETIIYKDTTGMSRKLNGLGEIKALLRDAIKDAHYTIGGYKTKYDPMLSKDIANAKRFGVKAYSEKIDGYYQLVVEGPADKVKDYVENYLAADASDVTDSIYTVKYTDSDTTYIKKVKATSVLNVLKKLK